MWPGGRATDLQRYTLDQINNAGGLGVILYPNQSWAGLAEQMAHTPAGMQAAMTNAFDTIRANAGASLLPSIMNLFDVISSNMPQIETLIMSAVGPISTVTDCIAGVIGAVFSMQNAFSSFFADNLQPLLIAGISLLVFFLKDRQKFERICLQNRPKNSISQ